MHNTTDFVPFEWDQAKFAPIRLAFSELEQDMNALVDNEFTWTVFIIPVLIVFATFLLAFSAMDLVFVLHGVISVAAFLLVRSKQITGHLLSRLTSATRFLFQLSGITFVVSTAGVLSGPFYRFSQKCHEQLIACLTELLLNLTIFANDHVLPFLGTISENTNATLNQVLAITWIFANETFEGVLDKPIEIWNQFGVILSATGQDINQIIAQLSSYAQETFLEVKLLQNNNKSEINFELLGACLVVFTVLSCAFKFLTRKAVSSSKLLQMETVPEIELMTSVEKVSPLETFVEECSKEDKQLSDESIPAASTPIKSPTRVNYAQQRAAMTPFMTPISVISEIGKDHADEVENENENIDNNEGPFEFSECMTSIKPMNSQEQKSHEGISVIDLSLDEDDENVALSIHLPSPADHSGSIQAQVANENAVDPQTAILPQRLSPDQAKIGLMVTVLGGIQRGRKLRRGGVGKITMIHDDGTVDVKFMIERGQETRIPMDNILVGSHPNAIGTQINKSTSESATLMEDRYLLRAAKDSLATRRRLSALADVSNLSDNSAASATSSKSSVLTASLKATTTARKPLYRAQRASDVATVNTSNANGMTTRASLRTQRASLE